MPHNLHKKMNLGLKDYVENIGQLHFLRMNKERTLYAYFMNQFLSITFIPKRIYLLQSEQLIS